MDFLLSSNVLIDFPLKDALEIFAQKKVDGVEIWVEHLWKERSSLEDLRGFMDSMGLKRTLHAPTRDVNITSSNPGIKAESVRQTLEALEIAYQLGIEVVTVHPGHMSSSKDSPEDFFEEQTQALFRIGKKAKELGIKVGVEVMERKPGELVVAPEDLNVLLDIVNLDSLGTTFDIAHAATHYKDSVEPAQLNGSIVDYMKRLRKIYNVHVSNSSLEKVHLPLSRGAYDFLPVLKELSEIYEGTVSIEGFVPGDGMRVLEENMNVIHRWKESLSNL